MPGASRWKLVQPAFAGWQEVGTWSATQNHELGFRTQGADRNETGATAGMADFIYIRAGVAAPVSYANDTFVGSASAANGTTLLAGALPVGSATPTAATYGWLQVAGDVTP